MLYYPEQSCRDLTRAIVSANKISQVLSACVCSIYPMFNTTNFVIPTSNITVTYLDFDKGIKTVWMYKEYWRIMLKVDTASSNKDFVSRIPNFRLITTFLDFRDMGWKSVVFNFSIDLSTWSVLPVVAWEKLRVLNTCISEHVDVKSRDTWIYHCYLHFCCHIEEILSSTLYLCFILVTSCFAWNSSSLIIHLSCLIFSKFSTR